MNLTDLRSLNSLSIVRGTVITDLFEGFTDLNLMEKDTEKKESFDPATKGSCTVEDANIALLKSRMAPELMNRFRHFNVQPDYDSFKAWAITENIHPYVLGFLSYDNSKLYAQSEVDERCAMSVPVLWIIIDQPEITMPWGRTVHCSTV